MTRAGLQPGTFAGERVFSSRVELRYILEPATERPDVLLVAVAAAPRSGGPPRYGMYRALGSASCHRLFVLDDHRPAGAHARPCWYLGSNRLTDVPDSVCELISQTADELGVPSSRIVTCGTSKGGWASLYFAARLGVGHAIVGEPQVLLGEHLLAADLLTSETLEFAAHIAGGTSSHDRDYLNEVLFAAFRRSASPPHVHLYCGRDSYYYAHDALPLVHFLERRGISTELELGDHSEHADVGLHFPGYVTARRRRPSAKAASGGGNRRS